MLPWLSWYEDHKGQVSPFGLPVLLQLGLESLPRIPHPVDQPDLCGRLEEHRYVNQYGQAVALIIPQFVELTRKPVTLGDHLRRRRIELGLCQKDVAARLDVTTSTVWNWENSGAVALRFIPSVVEFLDYDPVSQPEDLLQRLAWYKLFSGLNLERLGVEMGRNPEQLADWLSGRHKPCRRNREEIALFCWKAERRQVAR